MKAGRKSSNGGNLTDFNKGESWVYAHKHTFMYMCVSKYVYEASKSIDSLSVSLS